MVVPEPVHFQRRHIGIDAEAEQKMLHVLGYDDVEALMTKALPTAVMSQRALSLPPPASEKEVLERLRQLAAANPQGLPMIGLGYHPTDTPPVIRRRILESPTWYTSYTPYQPEISQGRLEALLNFQTIISDLTGLDIANSSLLDEATAVAEAVTLMRRGVRKAPGRVIVDSGLYPQSLAVVRTRCEPLGLEVVVADLTKGLPEDEAFGVVLQLGAADGAVRDQRDLVEQAHERGMLVTVAADPLSLTLIEAPGTWGADVVVGSAQRFGVPVGFGGPHAGFMAVRQSLARQMPGRLVGVSIDDTGRPAYRLALQTREQHIRREKATSNICTAQALLAIIASMYVVYHGPDGLKAIAAEVHGKALALAAALREGGAEVVHDTFFDTVLVRSPGHAENIVMAAEVEGLYLRKVDEDHVGIACSETSSADDLTTVVRCFGIRGIQVEITPDIGSGLPPGLLRTTEYLTHPVFHAHRSETELLRYMRRLGDRDFALDRGMIPLGSCTMKLNAAVEMEPISFPGFANPHPFGPRAAGYRTMISELESWLAKLTGYTRVSIQPNAGSQGELAGLLAIRGYHRSRGDDKRTICLIPSSAHGTNAASAVMAGMKVVVVDSASDGTIDMEDLRAKVEKHSDELAAVMVTYPSTHGVYEQEIVPLCDLIHEHGGQVYLDGANLNALLGYAGPGEFGGDVSHLNLHKTFSIPHGGGGPGVGPIGVREHLVPFLPGHPLHPDTDRRANNPVSAAPFGSASVLPITWAYIRLMGAEGLQKATSTAVLSANYIAKRLGEHYPVLYSGEGGLVAHECILDVRPLEKETGVTCEDIAKRLIDYGFHAPTMSFPVAGTLMIEPTESESLAELDRFIDAMITIKAEADGITAGRYSLEESPLRRAPHTAEIITGEWDRPYSRAEAVFPAGQVDDKYWPPVGRVDNPYGDRNLFCSCPRPTEFDESE